VKNYWGDVYMGKILIENNLSQWEGKVYYGVRFRVKQRPGSTTTNVICIYRVFQEECKIFR